jgi:hypothetical protein
MRALHSSAPLASSIVVLGILLWSSKSIAADYDTQRFDQIARAIAADKNQLLDKSLDEVTKLLGLEKVSWDEGYTNYPDGELRIYHFRGFYLTLHLELLPPGINPRRKASYSTQGLERSGVRWLAAFNPFVKVDGITDSKERMKEYWKAVGRGFEEKARRFDQLQRDAGTK